MSSAVTRFKTNDARKNFLKNLLAVIQADYPWIMSKKPVQLDIFGNEGILPGCQAEKRLIRLMRCKEVQGFAIFNETEEELWRAQIKAREETWHATSRTSR